MKARNVTILIDQVSNGFVLTLLDEFGSEMDKSIASASNLRGYGAENLATAIENLFDKAAKMQEMAAEDAKAENQQSFRELIDEVDSHYVAGVDSE